MSLFVWQHVVESGRLKSIRSQPVWARFLVDYRVLDREVEAGRKNRAKTRSITLIGLVGNVLTGMLLLHTCCLGCDQHVVDSVVCTITTICDSILFRF